MLLGQLVNYAALIAHLTRGGRRKFEPPVKLPGDDDSKQEQTTVIEGDSMGLDEAKAWAESLRW